MNDKHEERRQREIQGLVDHILEGYYEDKKAFEDTFSDEDRKHFESKFSEIEKGEKLTDGNQYKLF